MPVNLPRTARILDLGYGGGAWLLTMAGLGYRDLHGYDIDANSENAARLSRAESASVAVPSSTTTIR